MLVSRVPDFLSTKTYQVPTKTKSFPVSYSYVPGIVLPTF